MAVWLWTILLRGKACYPYNVGSDQEITISQLAETVATTLGGLWRPLLLQLFASTLPPPAMCLLLKEPGRSWGSGLRSRLKRAFERPLPGIMIYNE